MSLRATWSITMGISGGAAALSERMQQIENGFQNKFMTQPKTICVTRRALKHLRPRQWKSRGHVTETCYEVHTNAQ